MDLAIFEERFFPKTFSAPCFQGGIIIYWVKKKPMNSYNIAKNDYIKMINSLDFLQSKKKKYFRAPFLVLQVVTNRGVYSVPGRTI